MKKLLTDSGKRSRKKVGTSGKSKSLFEHLMDKKFADPNKSVIWIYKMVEKLTESIIYLAEKFTSSNGNSSQDKPRQFRGYWT